MSRVTLNDTILSATTKMVDGNPGAITVLMRLIKDGERIDPQGFMGGFGTVLQMDTFRIYGPDIWILYKDICSEDLVNLCAVLRAVQLGILPLEDLKSAIFHAREGAGKLERPLDVPALLKAVMEQLEEFNRPREGAAT